MRDFRDIALAQLADDEVSLSEHAQLARVTNLESERDTYRELLCVALQQLHNTTVALKQSRGSIRHQRERIAQLLEIDRAERSAV